MIEAGTVYLVGAGPGEPGLVTLRARELIERCDVLVYDQLTAPEVRGWTREDCRQIDVGKEAGRHSVPQPEIQRLLVEHARAGRSVVRLKGGDPFVFARGGEEARTLAEAGVPFEIVPGVTAALAAAAYAGIPLTHREHSSFVSFVTGHEDPEKQQFRVRFAEFAKRGGTLCIYMGVGKLQKIVDELRAAGLPAETPAAFVQWATLPRQRVLRTELGRLPAEVAGQRLGSPAIIFIGDTCRLPADAPALDWFESRPLRGQRVAITRSRQGNSRLRRLLEAEGAEVLELPLIETRAHTDPAVLTEVFAGLGSYEWIVFTSANGVRHFFHYFFRAYEDIRAFGGMRIACVGEGTAEALRPYHLAPELLPETATAEALADALIATDSLDSANVLLVEGNRNSPLLFKRLSDEGRAIVDRLPIYATDLTDLADHPAAEAFRREGADWLLFASSSAVKSYQQQQAQLRLDPAARQPRVLSIGPQTSAACREHGLDPAAQAADPSLESLVATLLDFAAKQ